MKKVKLVFVNREGGEMTYVKTFKSKNHMYEFVGRICMQKWVLKEVWFWEQIEED